LGGNTLLDNQEQQKLRNLGAVYTPPAFARLLTAWGITDPRDKVLDIGVGEGECTLAAFHRLVQLGASPRAAQRQIYGAEIYKPAYDKFTESAAMAGLKFPNVYSADFFDVEFPLVDSIAGNLPFVRRSLIDNVDAIRQSVFSDDELLNKAEVSKLSDLYIYCLLRGISYLKEGGKLSVITSDSWLNAKYGVSFKRYLKANFKIESLISLDRQIFDAEVKPVLMFATKKSPTRGPRNIHFIRVKNGLPAESLLHVINNLGKPKPDVEVTTVKSHDLTPQSPWALNFKSPDLCEELSSHDLMTPMANIAQTCIGVQTLAKNFFVITPAQAQAWQIEAEYLSPLAHSPKNFTAPSIENGAEPDFFLFYCSKHKEELYGTNALRYIEAGETTIVPVRGKGITVVGYHKKQRINEENRPFWYDLRSRLERRGRAEILIPRLIYRTFRILWNKAAFVPGELFIEFIPSAEPRIDVEVYLAVLSSSVTEVMLRANSQLYGGGTYNVSPGDIGNIPILNVTLLSGQQRQALRDAFRSYLVDPDRNRSLIDRAVYDALGYNLAMRKKVIAALNDLVALTTTAKAATPSTELTPNHK